MLFYILRWAYRAYLPAFEEGSPVDTVLNDPKWFKGCGGNSVRDLDTVEFRWAACTLVCWSSYSLEDQVTETYLSSFIMQGFTLG